MHCPDVKTAVAEQVVQLLIVDPLHVKQVGSQLTQLEPLKY
jgi:hypothetical protein